MFIILKVVRLLYKVRKPLEGVKKVAQDLSNSLVDVYTELPPFAIDLDTGKLLNSSRDPKKVLAGKRDLQEEIDSYRDDCDIYKILAKVAASGDTSFLNRKVGTFADLAHLPDNMNDLHFYVNNLPNNVEPDVLKIALGDAMTSPDVVKAIGDYVNKKLNNNNEVINNE